MDCTAYDNEILPPDLKRYRQVRWFFMKILLHALWWDILLNRPVLCWFRPPALGRYKKIVIKFRALAVEMGGVLIKLGQFLSIRVDILPEEITRELAGLQDDVPPERTEDILARIEADFGCPASELFEWFSPEPLGAASLAQVHAVRLCSGEPAVVKVLRPGIEARVESDLAAVRLACKWLKHYKRLHRRVDFDWLAREFTDVTRRELDFERERRNAAQLARDLADNPHVHIPEIFREYSAAHTLTLENVGYIRISDLAAIEAAGISRAEVADTLYNIYMQQVFETFFVHVDPHPGNLFVMPLPNESEKQAGITAFQPGDPIPCCPGRDFRIAFVDFGMMAETPRRLRLALREYVVGLGTQDARKVVQAYVRAGTLLPGADLNRLEEAHEALFERLGGVRVGGLKEKMLKEGKYFLDQYRDLIREAPFQVQVDMLFIMRAVGILSGLAATLDPEFDIWAKTLPHARKYAGKSFETHAAEWFRQIFSMIHTCFTLPENLGLLLNQTCRGKLRFQTDLSSDVQKNLSGLNQAVRHLVRAVLCAGFIIAAALLYTMKPESAVWTLPAALGLWAFIRTFSA